MAVPDSHQSGEIVGFQDHVAGTFLGTDYGELLAAKQPFVLSSASTVRLIFCST
jgi:hypothetical protein